MLLAWQARCICLAWSTLSRPSALAAVYRGVAVCLPELQCARQLLCCIVSAGHWRKDTTASCTCGSLGYIAAEFPYALGRVLCVPPLRSLLKARVQAALYVHA